jgi:hypothetical protein
MFGEPEPTSAVHESVYVAELLIGLETHPPFRFVQDDSDDDAELQLSPFPVTVQLCTLVTFQYKTVELAVRTTCGLACR